MDWDVTAAADRNDRNAVIAFAVPRSARVAQPAARFAGFFNFISLLPIWSDVLAHPLGEPRQRLAVVVLADKDLQDAGRVAIVPSFLQRDVKLSFRAYPIPCAPAIDFWQFAVVPGVDVVELPLTWMQYSLSAVATVIQNDDHGIKAMSHDG